MADIIVGAVVGELIEKLMSDDLVKLAQYKGIDSQLNKWTDKLTLIQDVLADAAQKQITQKAVESWLHSLEELAYDIDDVVDDMATEVIKRKLNQEPHATTSTSSKLLKPFPACCTNLHPHNMIYGHKMKSKVEEFTSRLNDLADERNKLDLLGVNVKAKTGYKGNYVRFQQTSLVDKSTVLGREADTEALIAKLLEDEDLNRKVSVMSIVGLGGIGKTTLAKILYNDEKVRDHFELRAWVCVSDEFNVFNISKAILQAVEGRNQEFASLDLLHVALKEKLANKRFLVVLDDVWNEDHSQWELLKSPLVFGSPGSKIIVTTRKNKVALVMGSDKPYDLDFLSDEIALSLFAYNALNEENFDKYPSLKVIAQGIIKKCHGLPLALVAVGRVLKIKGTSEDEWQEVLESEIWDIKDGGGILPALKLSYIDLPLHLKKLFAYCSLFPKEYLFSKEELVLLWMAEGFISQSKGSEKMKMEDLGRMYFEELQSRSFFQQVTENETRFTMHNLLITLAIAVAGDFFFMLDDKKDSNGRNAAFEKFRHFSFLGKPGEEYRNLKELHKSRRLRTFLPVSGCWPYFNTPDKVLVDLLPRLQLLRVLSLTRHSITSVPRSVGHLKHLRYLNFSETRIKKVPEQVSELYNLQSLLVRGCEELVSLPVSFAKLINLRHLDMSNTPMLRKTPLGIGRLTSLQTLSKVYIKGADGFRVSDLNGLLNLRGQLSIIGLDKVIDPQQATDANLEGKEDLISLNMEWNDVLYDSQNLEKQGVVFENLRPPTKLNKLKIFHYGGKKFPSWLGDPSFDMLTELSLGGCKYCISFEGASFPLLKLLEINDMEALEKWSIGSFPHVREIRIENCPKLPEISIDSIPSLEVFVLKKCSNCKKLVSEEEEHNVRSVLRDIYLFGCDSLESYNCPYSVEVLRIIECSSMKSLTFSTTVEELPSRLKSLEVRDCKNLQSFPHKHLQSLKLLENMEIAYCPSMDDSFPCGLWPPNLKFLRIGELNKPMSDWGLQNYPESLVQMWLCGENSEVTSFAMQGDFMNTAPTSFLLPPSLHSLTIYDFRDVESISEVVVQKLTHLQHLYILLCPNIRDVPQTTSSLAVYVYE
ncbi:putative disease resistance RPP13-like protein 1 [Rutidosis leptorrhynchoides]|uniref:putative disease resistance RPP13-like protein 1 n=1 Tax=Rutidosis leptorrhynchoides TaxID=125765 RepID=UPI003A994418